MNFSSEIYFLFFALYKHVTTSARDRIEKPKNLLNSGVDCKIEPSLQWAAPGTKFQFLRQGYFCVDKDSTMDNLVFNRVVGLRDTWSKVAKKG